MDTVYKLTLVNLGASMASIAPPRPKSVGTCNLCGATFVKSSMSSHLRKCLVTNNPPPSGRAGKPKKLLHLVVEGLYARDYWLHLEVPATATLADLDAFLRNIWLECCGHLSAFEIDGITYESHPSDDGGFGFFGVFREKGMNVTLGKVFRPGLKLTYEYDFGSTTPLAIRVLSEREGYHEGRVPRVLARNQPPPIVCGLCGQPATRVYVEQSDEPEGWLCDACAEKGEYDEDMFLPVVNSPRVGVCAYTGDDQASW